MIPNNNEEMQNRMENQPMIPLPDEGEGGPVYPGDENTNENIPMIPLPPPEVSFPVYPGNGQNGTNSNRPVIPLPNPGEGGPVYPGNNRPNNNNILSGLIETIITTYPRPNAPCRFCANGTRTGTIRFLNAASDYNPFAVYVNSDLFVSPLNYAEITKYEKVSSGMRTISVLGENGYVYIQKQVMIAQNQTVTIAIINTESGLDLMTIQDTPCAKPLQAGCIRTCNLALNSGPLSVVIGQRYITFMNVGYMEVTEFKNIWPGEYNYYVSRNGNAMRPFGSGTVLLSSTLTTKMNVSYTIYLFQWNLSSPDAVRALIVEEH